MQTVQPQVPEDDETASTSSARVAALIAATVIIYTLVGVFSNEKVSFLLKDVLGLSASRAATFSLIVGIPSYIRPFLGAGSDLFPLLGFHRRTYYALSWLLNALGLFTLSHLSHYHYAAVVELLIVKALGYNLLFVIIDAVMVAVGNRAGNVGLLQTIQQALPLILILAFGGVLSGYVTQHWSYLACFQTAALLAVLGVPLTLMIEERKVTRSQGGQESAQEHLARMQALRADRTAVGGALRQAASSPGLWAVVAFVFYLIITPGINTAQFYYSVNSLHFSKQFLGTLSSVGSAGSLAGIGVFALVSLRLPVRALVWGAFLMDCSLYLASMALHDHRSGLAVVFLTSFLGSVYNLCLLTLAARACPPGIEGAVYGLVMSSIYLAGALGEKFGANLFDYFGPGTHHSVTHGWFGLLLCGFAFTVVAAVFIPFLPAWAKSNEPLRPRVTA